MQQDIRIFLNTHLRASDFQCDPIEKGGSDRRFYRVRLPDSQSYILMQYGADVEENAYWVEINRFMSSLGVPVPRITAYDESERLILIEDLGEMDLFAKRTLPWQRRRHDYLTALSEIHWLHRRNIHDLPARLKLAKGYDESLYRWEHHYFHENFVDAVCRAQLPETLLREWTDERASLIKRLQSVPLCLIHRDLQSQNIMIKNNRPVFIDFQGARLGNVFYDLGSLICDPYVPFSLSQRTELIAFYYRIMQPDYSFDQFTSFFWEAAAQRLMQALGAYGFLGLQKKKTDFLKHTESGVRNLISATSQIDTLPVLHEIAKICLSKLPPAKKDMQTVISTPG